MEALLARGVRAYSTRNERAGRTLITLLLDACCSHSCDELAGSWRLGFLDLVGALELLTKEPRGR
eukprot:scaffold198717_cov17-Tisochrysis_lutea.AAC.1